MAAAGPPARGPGTLQRLLYRFMAVSLLPAQVLSVQSLAAPAASARLQFALVYTDATTSPLLSKSVPI